MHRVGIGEASIDAACKVLHGVAGWARIAAHSPEWAARERALVDAALNAGRLHPNDPVDAVCKDLYGASGWLRIQANTSGWAERMRVVVARAVTAADLASGADHDD